MVGGLAVVVGAAALWWSQRPGVSSAGKTVMLVTMTVGIAAGGEMVLVDMLEP